MNNPFLGKVALVTGGSRGIGKATSLALARLGVTVVVNYVCNENNAQKFAADLDKINAKYMLVKADVSDYTQVKDMMMQIEARFGNIHFLINNAGIVRDRTIRRMELSEWDEVIATNLTGVFNCCKAVLDHMVLEEGSRIVIISSVVGKMGNFGQVNYAVAKAGLIGLTKSLAKELARHKVTVNTVVPGFTHTQMIDQLQSEVRAKIIQNIPLKRFAMPDEIAHAVVFLCSPLAGFITGTSIDVNGGMYM